MKIYVGIIALLCVLVAPIALKYSFSSKRTLFIYTWCDYIRPDLLQQFQKEHNCRIVVDTYDSNEAMYTKLKFGCSGYDLIFPSGYFLELMAEQKMLLPLPEPLIPNSKNVDWEFLHKLGIFSSSWGVPYTASFSGIGWRKDRMLEAPQSWSIFANRALRGRMTMLNDMRETIGAGLVFLGYSPNTKAPEEIEEATALVCRWKKQLARLESEQYKNGLASAEYLVVHGYSGDCLQIARTSENIDFSYPTEGCLASIDYMAILRSSHDPQLACEFINFLHTPAIAAKNIDFTNYRCLNVEAKKLLPESLQNSSFLYPETIGTPIKFHCINPVGSAQRLYARAWNTVKGAS